MSAAALILAAHGSSSDSSAHGHLRAIADRLAARGGFDSVTPAFHRGEPQLDTVLDGIGATRVIVVPIMTSDGWFCRRILPQRLAANRRYGSITVRITPPIGTHPLIATILAERVRNVLRQHRLEPRDTTAAIIGHGTARHAGSRAATLHLVDHLRALGLCGEVIVGFLDDEPRVDTLLDRATLSNVLAIPFFISGGPHATSDVPRSLGLTLPDGTAPPFAGHAGGRLVVVDRALGLDERMIDLIEDRARSALVGMPSPMHPTPPTLRLGTRASKLALWQANHVASLLRNDGVFVEIIEIATTGDRDLTIPIESLPSDAPFTDDIEDALRAGDIDLAVHALKDMPTHPARDLAMAAVLRRGDASEALVSKSRLRLGELAPGAVVGTSSPRRAAQLRLMRPDLVTCPIRGAVDDRVRQVLAGRFDAAIMATAGLQRLGLDGEIAQQFAVLDFLPAPGQAALAVQVRADDERTVSIVAHLDDDATRRAVETELALLRELDDDGRVSVAAFAEAGDEIALHARLLQRNGTEQRDVSVSGRDPRAVANEAIARLRGAAVQAAGAPC